MHPVAPSLAGKLAIGAFAVLSLVGGWLIVVGGGFAHAPAKFSKEVVFVSGLPALAMALIQFTGSAIAFTWLLRQKTSAVQATAIALALVFVPPALYLLLG